MQNKIHRIQLKKLLKTTTLRKIVNNSYKRVVGTDKYASIDEHPQKLRFQTPYDFDSLSKGWQSIWNSFGKDWNTERQLFRYFWDECRGVFQSYKLYQTNFEGFVPLTLDNDPLSNKRMDVLSLNCELAFRSIYEYGKQAIDLIEKLDPKILTSKERTFCSQFSETRNKFLTHYHNPNSYPDFIFAPVYWSLMGTGNLFEIEVHIPNTQEKNYTMYINHRWDYFRLEAILVRFITEVAKRKGAKITL